MISREAALGVVNGTARDAQGRSYWTSADAAIEVLYHDCEPAIAQAVLPHGLRRVMAAHLSEQNNRPELARAALVSALGEAVEIHVADGPTGSGWLDA